MDYIFAPNQERADNFLRDNEFGLDDRAVVRLDYHATDGMRFSEHDVIYILDGCDPTRVAVLQRNVARSRAPATISVEER